MVMRVYLKPDAVTKPKGGSWKYKDELLSHPDGIAYIDLTLKLPETTELPPDLDEKDVWWISYHDTFYGGGIKTYRASGEYSFRSASAVVEGAGSEAHRVRMTARKLSDASTLYREIRAGTIFPTVSFEEKQVPPPARHLWQLLREAWAIIRRDTHQKLLHSQ